MNVGEFNRLTEVRRFAAERLPDMIRERLSDRAIECVYAKDAYRNNGQRLLGISVVETGLDFSPCIYVEPYIPPDPSVLQQRGVWGRIADRLADDFRFALDASEPVPEDVFRLEEAEEHLILKVVNRERNKLLRERFPHKDVLDLTVLLEWEVFCGKRRGLIHVSKNALEQWDRSFDEMFEIALANTMKRYPERIEPLGDLLMEMAKRLPVTGGSSPFYFVGTNWFLQGSVVMVYPGIFRRIYEAIGEAYYLIPSSIHELLALPLSFDTDLQRVKDITWEINTYLLEPSEVLSDSVYLYHPETDFLEIIPTDYS